MRLRMYARKKTDVHETGVALSGVAGGGGMCDGRRLGRGLEKSISPGLLNHSYQGVLSPDFFIIENLILVFIYLIF